MRKFLYLFLSLSIVANILLILAFFNQSKWTDTPEVNLSVWVNEAAVSVYTYSYQNWHSREEQMGRYFMPKAWTAYLNAINQSNILKQVGDKHMQVTAVATTPPTITNINPNRYKVKIPLVVSYKGDDGVQIQHLTLQLEIVKTNTMGIRGYAINQFIANIDPTPCTCENDLGPKVTIV